MDSEIDTDRLESAESTVEEKSPVKKKHTPFNKRKRSGTTNNTMNKVKKSNTPVELVHETVGKLPNRALFSQYDENSEEVFCLCRKPDNGDLMVACDGCDEWFHFDCVKIDRKFQQLVLSYHCPYCELEGKGQTLWKRKCRLIGCFNGISGNESKYCSKEHGLKFMKGVIEKAFNENENSETTLNKENLVQLTNEVPELQKFRALGSNFPEPAIDFNQNPKILKIIESLQQLSYKRTQMIQRKKLLILTRENIKKINDLLTNEIDGEINTTTKSRKGKAKKVEICGYDPLFREENINASELEEDNLKSKDSELLKKKFLQLREEQSAYLSDVAICLQEKKKCQKHNGWQSMINDEIDMNIENIDTDIVIAEQRLKKTLHTLKINHYELSEPQDEHI